ncbi:hypothetical protein G7068_03240 [Leucobacter viscericola]|uniref:Lipoprotein n=1 Tax=Leucobacter viscericola TaxID=2714935 RepID=A0A6G7XD10_9MICO|nr:hypothetical protein [Leucobacter viscericola]QIK62329.1 hypothetical protein G7068_03240 [Leucobacter viscericola]
MKRTLGIVAALTMSISLMACSGGANNADEPKSGTDATQAEAEAPTLFPAGPFEFTTETGAKITFDLPSAADDERIADIEKYRVDTNASPVTYVIANVDNRKGTDYAGLTNVSAFDKEGRKYEFTEVFKTISDWQPYYSEDHEYVMPDGSKVAEDVGTELYNRGIDIYNKFLKGPAPAEQGTVVLVSKDVDLPSEFTRVAVTAGEFGTPAGDATPAKKSNS